MFKRNLIFNYLPLSEKYIANAKSTGLDLVHAWPDTVLFSSKSLAWWKKYICCTRCSLANNKMPNLPERNNACEHYKKKKTKFVETSELLLDVLCLLPYLTWNAQVINALLQLVCIVSYQCSNKCKHFYRVSLRAILSKINCHLNNTWGHVKWLLR